MVLKIPEVCFIESDSFNVINVVDLILIYQI